MRNDGKVRTKKNNTRKVKSVNPALIKQQNDAFAEEGINIHASEIPIGRVKKLIPQSPNQELALEYLSKKVQMVLLTGTAGTGKTEIAVWYACTMLAEGHIDNIVIARSNDTLGKSDGATKGNDSEKLLPFCMPMLMKMCKYLSPQIVQALFKKDDFEDLFMKPEGIRIQSVAKVQGMSLDSRTLVILDEAQNCDHAQMKSMSTRIEEGCMMIICGDPTQSSKGKGENGLKELINILEEEDLVDNTECSIVKFTSEDDQRGGMAGKLAKAYEKRGAWVADTCK